MTTEFELEKDNVNASVRITLTTPTKDDHVSMVIISQGTYEDVTLTRAEALELGVELVRHSIAKR